MKVAVIADDLTGANDTAVQFAKLGLRTFVVLTPESDYGDAPQQFEAIVVNTDSRAMNNNNAYAEIFRVSRVLREFNPLLVYKKLDSTLRGNVAAEINAAMDGFGFTTAVVAAAFPKIGRTTQNGVHMVNGTPLAETEAAKDPRMPVSTSALAANLRTPGGREVKSISLPQLARLRATLLESNEAILACDAVNNQDLEVIAALAPRHCGKTLFAGSAGLAEYLPQQMGWGIKEPYEFVLEKNATHPSLAVVGSMSQKTMEQIAYLRRNMPGVCIVSLSPDHLLSPFAAEHVAPQLGKIVASLQQRLPAVLVVTGEKIAGESATIAVNLGLLVREVLTRVAVNSLLLTGGDIANAVCSKLEVAGIRVLSELATGIPYGKFVGGMWDGLSVVTKAGAFGTEDSILQVITELNDLDYAE